MKKILIAAGGTGGHLYPGIALARELSSRGCEPLFVVKQNDMCRDILKAEHCGFAEIPARGFPRRLSLGLVTYLFSLGSSLFAARALLRKTRPSAVVGMGGYISFPVIVASKLAGIPAVIHEQNYLPGLANRVLSRLADRVAVTFEGSRSAFPKHNTVVTGNPVRRELFGGDYAAALSRLQLHPGKFTVLVFGGSLGAAAINQAVADCWALLSPAARNNTQFLHITGKKDDGRTAAAYQEKNIPGIVLPYLNEIGDAYAVADLIICRAGATTIAELGILGTPAILIPYPHATANHQELNARVLVTSGQAVMILEKDLSPQALAREITVRCETVAAIRPALTLPHAFPQEIVANIVLELT